MKHHRSWTRGTEQPVDHRDPTITWTVPAGATDEVAPTRRWTASTTDPRTDDARSWRVSDDHEVRRVLQRHPEIVLGQRAGTGRTPHLEDGGKV